MSLVVPLAQSIPRPLESQSHSFHTGDDILLDGSAVFLPDEPQGEGQLNLVRENVPRVQ